MSFDIDKILKALDWVLERATIVTGVFAALGALSWAATTALKLPYFGIPETSHDTLDKLGLRILYFWVILALMTIIIKIQKHTKQSAAIAAEQIRLNPNVEDESVVPAVHDEIVKQLNEKQVTDLR